MATLSSKSQPLQATARPAPRQTLDCRIAGSLVTIQGLPPSLRPHVEFLLQPFAVEAQQAKPALRLRIKRNGPANWAVFVGETQRRAEVAVRLAAQAQQCCRITNGPIIDTLDLIEAAAE